MPSYLRKKPLTLRPNCLKEGLGLSHSGYVLLWCVQENKQIFSVPIFDRCLKHYKNLRNIQLNPMPGNNNGCNKDGLKNRVKGQKTSQRKIIT